MKNTIQNNYAYLGNNRAVTMAYFARKIIIDTCNIQNYSIITHGFYEKGVVWAIEKYLKTNDIMIDAGANACEIFEKSPKCVVITERNPSLIWGRGSFVNEAIEYIAQRFKKIGKIIKIGKASQLNPYKLKNISHCNLILGN